MFIGTPFGKSREIRPNYGAVRVKYMGTIPMNEYIVLVPVVVGVAPDVATAIYHEYTLAGRRHALCESSASESGSDYNPISFHRPPRMANLDTRCLS
jgi:hypothetical protein